MKKNIIGEGFAAWHGWTVKYCPKCKHDYDVGSNTWIDQLSVKFGTHLTTCPHCGEVIADYYEPWHKLSFQEKARAWIGHVFDILIFQGLIWFCMSALCGYSIIFSCLFLGLDFPPKDLFMVMVGILGLIITFLMAHPNLVTSCTKWLMSASEGSSYVR